MLQVTNANGEDVCIQGLATSLGAALRNNTPTKESLTFHTREANGVVTEQSGAKEGLSNRRQP